MPGPSCKPVRTVLDPRGNAMTITDCRARHLRGNALGIIVNRPQYRHFAWGEQQLRALDLVATGYSFEKRMHAEKALVFFISMENVAVANLRYRWNVHHVPVLILAC